MLRALILAFLCMVSVARAGEASQAKLPQYVAPSEEEMQRQREAGLRGIEDAKKLMEDREFTSEIDKQRQTVNRESSLAPGLQVDRLTEGRAVEPLYLKELMAGSGQHDIPDQPARDKPLVLISLSMPENEIRALLKELKKVDSGAVLRGLVNNDFKETISILRGMVLSDSDIAGVSIDPTLFQRFEVEAVPTFILPLEPVPLCAERSCPVSRHVKATGSVSLSYFLETVARAAVNDEEKNTAMRWLEVLQQ